MLPSINNMNGNISCYTDQTPFSNLYHFPYETDNNNEFFLQQYQDLPLITTSYNYNRTSSAEANHVIHNMVDNSNKNSTRKRFSKKDRHSKINTAQGPRDRRMRLSLEIARQFFALQDMLGFDKASKTVEWLLSKAKLDIKKLVAKSSGDRLFQTVDYSSSTVVGAKSASSSASECEVISGTDPHVFTDQNPPKCVNKKEKIRLREVRKAAFRPVRARESREKARARARERTNYKKKMCEKSKLFAEEDATTNQDSNQVGSSWSPMSLEALHERGHVGATTDMVDDDHSLAITDKWSPTSIIMTYLHGSTGFPQEHQFGDFHFYNIQSLL